MIEQKLKGENVSYEQYCAEIARMESQEYQGSWIIKQSLIDKVDQSGRLLSFFGDTVVYTLPSDEQLFFKEYQERLIASCGTIFAEPLDYQQFHITIHDLSNGPDQSLIAQEMISNQRKCQAIISNFGKSENKIKIQLSSIYPSRKIGVIANFLPATNDDYQRLLAVYNQFEQVKLLSYWPHLHVTLNYFLPQVPSSDQQKKVFEWCQRESQKKIELTIDLSKSVYQHFFDMNDYKDIFPKN